MHAHHLRWLSIVATAAVLALCSDAETPSGANDTGDQDTVADTGGGNDVGTIDAGQDSGQPDTGDDVDPDAPEPGTFGAPCASDFDCNSGYCVDSPEGTICTTLCEDTCPEGWECRFVVNTGADAAEICLPEVDVLCFACSDDSQCGGPSDRCVDIGDASYCAIDCRSDAEICPEGFTCEEVAFGDGTRTASQCIPESGSCLRCVDLDGDTYGEGEECTDVDCDDLAPQTFPGAAEVCDNADNDCDEAVDEDFDLTSDLEHCGACDNACALDHATALCEASTCVVDTCADGFFDLDGIDDNGCEADCAPTNGGVEVLDDVDNDCDGTIDEDTEAWDDDGDGYCEVAPCLEGVLGGGDCDDDDDTVYPDAPEDGGAGTNVGDGIDNDCDGLIDEGTRGVDDDNDGYCEAEVLCSDGSTPGDCDDGDVRIYPGAPERPNDLDDDCDGEIDEDTSIGDDDHDGYNESEGDCDDTNDQIHPNAPELPNGVDDDCDGPADEGTILYDDDGDGFCEGPDPCTFGALGPGDCNDGEPGVNPDATETLNGRDDDCDGDIDDETAIWDDDGDGYCEVAPCSHGDLGGGDCDDANSDVHPGADEVRNGRDDNCNSTTDEGTTAYDDDLDGYCEVGPCVFGPSGEGDCDDTRRDVYPGAPEDGGDGDQRADGVNNDCDMFTDEGTLDYDDDGDGYCDAMDSCIGGATPGDCDDGRMNVHPGAAEVVDGLDNDCDMIVDNGTDVTDDDGDGFSEIAGDCNDDDNTIYPMAPEDGGTGTGDPDGKDNDCDGQVDEGTVASDDDNDGFCEVAPCAVPGVLGGDCNDANPNVNPGRLEICGNGVNDDCRDGVDVVDNDQDGVIDAACGGTDCDDADATIYPGAPEIRDGLDNDCDTDGVADEGLISVGDIRITEIMADPAAPLGDSNAEWLELYNPTDVPINMRGWWIYDIDCDARQLVGEDLIVPPREFVTIGNGPSASNGGIEHALIYSDFTLANGGDEVRLCIGTVNDGGAACIDFDSTCTGTVVDSLDYAGVTTGRSYQRDAHALTSSTFCPLAANSATYSAGNDGTPGEMNLSCTDDTLPTVGRVIPAVSDAFGPIASGVTAGGEDFFIIGNQLTGVTSVTFDGASASFTSVNRTTLRVTSPAGSIGDATVRVVTTAGSHQATNVFRYYGTITTIGDCRLLNPTDVTAFSGFDTPYILGSVFVAGVTTTGGRSAGILGQLGYGTTGADPRTQSGWVWVNSDYALDDASADVHGAVLNVVGAGTYATAYRFTHDGGANWRFCDTSGGGFSLPDLGTLTVE